MRAVILITLLCMISLIIGCGGSEVQPSPSTAPKEIEESSVPSDEDNPISIVVETTSNPYAFAPTEFEIQSGQTYEFAMTADNELHSFTVTELGLNVNVLPNTTQIINLKFNEPGTYKLICLPHEIYGMVATIKVN